jgi:hypothetical protein
MSNFYNQRDLFSDLHQNIKGPLSISTFVEQSELSNLEVHKCWGMLNLDVEGVNQVIGADFVLVIDVSASMTVDEKLTCVFHAVEYVLSSLTEIHRLSVIVFNHNVTVLCPLLNCDKSNKKMILKRLSAVEAYGSTNISDALFTASEILNEREDSNRLSTVLLITDGFSNRGLTGEQTVNSLSNINLPNGCVCNTFGFGDEHDSRSLLAISSHTQGNYYYVENPEDISKYIKISLDEMLSTTVRNVQVKLRAQDGSRVIAIKMPYALKQLTKTKDYDISIGGLRNFVSKTILFKLSLRKFSNPIYQPLMNITVDYEDVLGNSYSLEETVYVNRTPHPILRVIPQILDENINRIAAAKVITESIELSDQLQFTQAKEKLDQIISIINSSSSSKSSFSVILVNKLLSCISGMSDIISFQKGIHEAHEICSNIIMQTTSTDLSELDGYFNF